MIKMISIILGGGAGTRLYPLTKERSKPAVPVAGKYRLIDIPISNCINSGVKRMFVLTQYNSASLNAHIKNSYFFDHFSPGFVDVLAAEQTPQSNEWFQGTADAVKQCMPHLKNHDFDYVLILSGDQLYQMNFEEMVNDHIRNQAQITIATIPVNAEDATGFGIMKVEPDHQIKTFVEKPGIDELEPWKSDTAHRNQENGKHYLASMGIYIFNRNILSKLFDELPEATDFGKEIIPTAINTDFKVCSYAYQGYWTDIGTIKSFFEANIALTANIPSFNLFDDGNQIYTRARMLAPAKILGARLNHALVAESSMIHAELCEYCIIGLRSRIGYNTIIRRAIIFGNDYFQRLEEIVHNTDEIPMGIGNNCLIEQAIIEKDCRIGDNVIIRGDDSLEDVQAETHCIVDGIIVLKKGAIIPSGTIIGIS